MADINKAKIEKIISDSFNFSVLSENKFDKASDNGNIFTVKLQETRQLDSIKSCFQALMGMKTATLKINEIAKEDILQNPEYKKSVSLLNEQGYGVSLSGIEQPTDMFGDKNGPLTAKIFVKPYSLLDEIRVRRMTETLKNSPKFNH